jgi:hypothetical protein
MANVTITGLNSPGSKRKAAPGLPEIARSLGALLGVQFRWNSNMSIYYAIYTTRSGGEHVFAADPKILHSEYLWIEWSKLVADFLAGKGEAQRTLDLNDQIRVLSAKVVTDDGFQEQTSTVGGPDDSSGSECSIGSDGNLFVGDPGERPAPWQYTTSPAATESGSDEPVTD